MPLFRGEDHRRTRVFYSIVMKKVYQNLMVNPIRIEQETGLMTQSVVTMKAKMKVESYEDHKAFDEEGMTEWGQISF